MESPVDVVDAVVLVIDDSSTHCEALQSILKNQPYRLSFEGSGEAGLGKALRLLPNLILLDIELPGIDGLATLEILKKLKTVQDIPVMLMTGSKKPEYIVKGFELGAVDYITKPYNAYELQARIKSQLVLQSLLLQQRQQIINAERFVELADSIAGFTHEISTPIGVSITATSQLENDIKHIKMLFESKEMKRTDLEKFLEMGWEAARIAIANLERAGRLIASFKRVTVDQCSEQADVIALREYIDQIILTLNPKLKKTKHKIIVNCDPDLMLQCYPGAISQIFINLIMNSVIHGFEFIESGRIQVDIKSKEENIIIEYRDNGKGLEQVTLQRIFDKYYTTRRGKGGSGLGMAIVKDLVTRQMHGKIEVQSTPGSGVLFLMTLPKKLA